MNFSSIKAVRKHLETVYRTLSGVFIDYALAQHNPLRQEKV